MATYKSNFDKWDVGVAIGRTNPTPLDSTEVQSFADLTKYAKSGATSYVGQIVKTISNSAIDGCYIIKNANGDLIKLTTDDDLKKFGGVFQFQGVASAIDADHCTLTIGNPSVLGVELSCTLQVTDVEGDLYFNWTGTATDETPVSYWTKGSIYEGVANYEVDAQDDVNYFIYDGIIYYQAEATVENGKTKYLSIDGDDYYVGMIGADYHLFNTPNSEDKDSLGAITLYQAAHIYFAKRATDPKPANITGVEVPGETKIASDGTRKDGDQVIPSNKGHVYQLGEEEYASNGTIWVLLGSPKEDWIVIK